MTAIPGTETSPLGLDYVSPLPPVRSGIADYSVDLTFALAGRCDLRLVCLPGQPVDPSRLPAVPRVEAAALGASDRLPLYQMGNNPHHAAIPELAARWPGVLTLHDFVLHHFMLGETLGRGQFVPYRERMVRDHGWVGWEVARPASWMAFSDAQQFSLPVQRSLLRSQRGVLVHSRWAADEIAFDAADVAVRVVPMGVPLPEATTEGTGRALRRRLGIPDAAPVLGSLGFQTPMKRTQQVVRALGRPELQGVHLIVAGEVSPALDLASEIRAVGAGDRVHVLGFLPYDEFQAAVAACDICVNLRYPTAGETSASLLRILAIGRPVLVSDYAQFAELPAAFVDHVPLGEEEIPALAARVRRLLDEPEERRRRAAAAREYVRREHDPGLAARRVLEACRELAGLEPPASRPLPPMLSRRRPTSLTWSFLGGRLQVEEPGRPWRVGEARELRLRLSNGGWARWLATQRGEGGVHVRVRFRGAGGRPLERQRWLPLLRDLDPGETVTLSTTVRRPPGSRQIVVEPMVAGNSSFWALEGPTWQQDLDPPAAP